MAENRSSSTSLEQRERALIAHGALTNSKRPESFVYGVYPTHLKRGLGSLVWDHRGKQYVDFICALGANLLGYANEEVERALVKQLRNGITLSLATEHEIILAEKLKGMFPWVERMRFLKTGTEACMAAMRIARAYKNNVVVEVESDGYHGHGDEFISLSPPAIGVPLQRAIKKASETVNSEIIRIIEPVVTDFSQARIDKLREIRTKTSCLIHDEVITGFRWPKYSVSNYYGVEPDILVLGKGLAGGLPLSVIAGKKSVMECDEYFVSSTFAGETLSIVAAITTIDLLHGRYSLQELWEFGTLFWEKMNDATAGVVKFTGYPTRGILEGEPATKALFMQEMCKAGVLMGASYFYNFTHKTHEDFVLSCARDSVMRIKSGNVRLEGQIPKSPFAERVRNGKSS